MRRWSACTGKAAHACLYQTSQGSCWSFRCVCAEERRYRNFHQLDKCSLLLASKKSVWSVDVRLDPAALLCSVAQIASFLNYKLHSAASWDFPGLSEWCELLCALIYKAGAWHPRCQVSISTCATLNMSFGSATSQRVGYDIQRYRRSVSGL